MSEPTVVYYDLDNCVCCTLTLECGFVFTGTSHDYDEAYAKACAEMASYQEFAELEFEYRTKRGDVNNDVEEQLAWHHTQLLAIYDALGLSYPAGDAVGQCEALQSEVRDKVGRLHNKNYELASLTKQLEECRGELAEKCEEIERLRKYLEAVPGMPHHKSNLQGKEPREKHPSEKASAGFVAEAVGISKTDDEMYVVIRL